VRPPQNFFPYWLQWPKNRPGTVRFTVRCRYSLHQWYQTTAAMCSGLGSKGSRVAGAVLKANGCIRYSPIERPRRP
jgi:hypothetical protein